MLDFDNQSDVAIDISLLQEIANRVSRRDLELIIVCDGEMQKLNKNYRGKDASTDVLSFPLDDFGIADNKDIPLGSIVICIDEARRASKLHKHDLMSEVALLFIHGILHLLGYDHEKDSGEHRKAEEELISEFNLPSSLIVRAESNTLKSQE